MPVIAGVLFLVGVVLVLTRPVLRRLAFRNVSRRPRETALILLGSMFGTAIITGSGIVGDTLDASITRLAFTQLGPVDETVTGNGAAFGREVEARLRALPSTEVDGILRIDRSRAAVATGAGDDRRAEPNAAILEVDFAQAAAFGGDPEATGITGPTPVGSQAAVGEDLADTLQVDVGDPINAYLYGQTLSLEVVRVLPRLGIAGLGGEGSESPTVFVAEGTLERLHAAAPPGTNAPTGGVLISNVGGVLDGAVRSDHVVELAQELLTGIPAQVSTVKQDLLEAADREGSSLRTVFTSIGMFSVIAGIMLLVNIFVMLAQERKTELGMLRAVGMRRSGLVGSFTVEGWLYALGAASLGTVAGIGVGRLIVLATARIFDRGEGGLDIRYAVQQSTLVQGFLIGFAVSMLTVLLTAVVISRLNVIRAIRDLPEPETVRTRRWVLVLSAAAVVLGGVVTVGSITDNDPFGALAGPGILAMGLFGLLGRILPRRATGTALAVLALLWGVFSFDLFPEVFDGADIDNFVVLGLLLTGSAVALVSQNQDVFGGTLRRIAGHSNLSLRLGLAYPLARRFRTAMTLGMYALVVFTLVFITIFSSLFGNQVEDFTEKVSAGATLRLDSNRSNPVAVDAVAALPEVAGVAGLTEVVPKWSHASLTDGEFEFWWAVGYDESAIGRGAPVLKDRGVFASDAEAYRAVLADPAKVIVSEFFLQLEQGPPGEPIEIGDPLVVQNSETGATRDLTVVAIAEAGFGNPYAFMPRSFVEELFGTDAVTNLLFVETKPGVDADTFADQLNFRFLEQGANAETFRAFIETNLSQQLSFFRLMQGYLALGLLVGIAGLGVVMIRAVRERRRQVGVLRSLGFSSTAVRRAFVAESCFVAIEGIAIGMALAVVTAWRVVANDTFGGELSFTAPWGQLALLFAATLLASLAATAAPAQQASRIRPAVALRITD